MDGSLRYFLVLSTIAHAAVLSWFGVTFNGSYAAGTRHPPIVVWGRMLRSAPGTQAQAGVRRPAEAGRVEGLPRPERVFNGPGSQQPRKPARFEAVLSAKRSFSYAAAPEGVYRKRDSVVMIHPLLPFQLQMYFKDRQSVHIELMFRIIVTGSRRQVLVRRKISSGNLDADLLCARYLGHYLFIEQARFVPNTWQTVRIDLSR